MHKGRFCPRFKKQWISVGCKPPGFAPVRFDAEFRVGRGSLGDYYFFWRTEEAFEAEHNQIQWDGIAEDVEGSTFDVAFWQNCHTTACNVWFYLWAKTPYGILTAKIDVKDVADWTWDEGFGYPVQLITTPPGFDQEQPPSLICNPVPYY